MIIRATIRWIILGLLLLNAGTTFTKNPENVERKPLPSFTDVMITHTMADYLELGEKPTIDKVVTRVKEKLNNLDDYAERVALKPRTNEKPYLTGSQLVKLKERNLRMHEELDQILAKAKRNNRTTGIKRAFRFVTSALHIPVKIAGKVRSGVERLLPNEIRPIFRVLVGKYMLNKYNTFLKAFATKHSTPELIRALDIWKSALIVKENPQIISKILRGRLDQIGRDELGELIAGRTQSVIGKLPDNALGQILGEILVMKAKRLHEHLGDILTEKGGIVYDKAFKEKITELTSKVVALTPGKNVQKQFEKAGNEFEAYILKRGAGLGQEGEQDQKPESEKIIAAFEASPMSGMEPLTVTFDASDSKGPIVKYTWWFGDQENEVEGKSATHTFDASYIRNHSVILTVYAADGSKATAEKTIVVKKETRINLQVVELTAEPAQAKVGQTVKFESTTEIKGCDAGKAKYTLYIDGKIVDVATTQYQGLDYDLEFNFNTTLPQGITEGEHTAEIEIAFTVEEAEKKSAIGSIIEDRKSVRFTIVGKEDVGKQKSNTVPNCPVPSGAEYEENEDGWSYWKDGIQTGPFVYWDPDNHNTILSRGCLDEEGKLQGKFESWFEKNKPKEFAEYAHGILHGKSVKWKENGDKESETSYKMGKRHGAVNGYDRGELISSYQFQDGKMDGTFRHYFRNKNGILYLESTGQYNKGRKVLEKNLHESGVTLSISTIRYAGDDEFENRKYFNLDGTKTSDYNYLNGEEHGTCMSTFGGTTEICQYDKGVLIKCEKQ